MLPPYWYGVVTCFSISTYEQFLLLGLWPNVAQAVAILLPICYLLVLALRFSVSAMASIHQRPDGNWHVSFRLGGKQFKPSLKTTIESKAKAKQAVIEETLQLIDTGRITLPAECHPQGDYQLHPFGWQADRQAEPVGHRELQVGR